MRDPTSLVIDQLDRLESIDRRGSHRARSIRWTRIDRSEILEGSIDSNRSGIPWGSIDSIDSNRSIGDTLDLEQFDRLDQPAAHHRILHHQILLDALALLLPPDTEAWW